jgi:hypothetical protein
MFTIRENMVMDVITDTTIRGSMVMDVTIDTTILTTTDITHVPIPITTIITIEDTLKDITHVHTPIIEDASPLALIPMRF